MSFQINQLKEAFQQNGYVVVPNFLDSNELRTVQKNIERLIQITHQKRNYEHAFYANEHDKSSLKQLHHIEEDDFFKTYSISPRCKTLARELHLGPVSYTHLRAHET